MRKRKPTPAALPLRTKYFRDHKDYIMHLAVQLAELSGFQISARMSSNEKCDLNIAKPEDQTEARELLKRIGVRTPDESAPAWHFVNAGGNRATDAPVSAVEAQPAADVPMQQSRWGPDPSYRP